MSNHEKVPAASEGLQDLGLDQHLCFALYGASITVGRLYKPVLDGWGLTYPQYLAIAVLWEQDGQPIGAVAERIGLEASTLTPMVRRLEAGGFVARSRNPADERQVILTLTQKGAALRDESPCLAKTLLDATGMPIAELQRINEAVRALRDAIARRGASASS